MSRSSRSKRSSLQGRYSRCAKRAGVARGSLLWLDRIEIGRDLPVAQTSGASLLGFSRTFIESIVHRQATVRSLAAPSHKPLRPWGRTILHTQD